MFEMIQNLILLDEPEVALRKFRDYVYYIQEPYFLTLTEYRRICSLTSHEYLGYGFISAIDEALTNMKKIRMDEELFCDFIKQFSERNRKHPNSSICDNEDMFNIIIFYSCKYGLDMSMLCDMAIPEYMNYLKELRSNYPVQVLVFPANIHPPRSNIQ